MDHGIDEGDPFGVGALFIAQSLAHRFGCGSEVDDLLVALLELEIPLLPDADVATVVEPIDALLDRVEGDPILVELLQALLRFAIHTPPRTPVSERLFRSVLWTVLRHDRNASTPDVLELLRASTPGSRFQAPDWPRHEFFSTVVALVYLGGPTARAELDELVAAARDLDYHDLAPILEWYLDHEHVAPTR